MATELAKAYVQIIPSAQGIKGSITQVLGGEAGSAGKSLGSTLASNIKNAIIAAGIGKAITQTLTEGAALEQSIGGVETLFKTSADQVIAAAQNAYKTAGLSANAYMETITSFSATLLQGLNGDTAKAAQIADMALVDMSDNANKMGTSMESIRYAYQGFARDNYTMLDNLKLGYGGTQSEMARLINDSGVLGDSIKVTAESVKDVPFDKVIEAIHTIQTNLGITGTTAQEAATTLSGSFASVKSALSNVLAGLTLGQDIGPALDALASSLTTFLVGNLIPALWNIISALPGALVTFISSLGTQMVAAIEQIFPQMQGGIMEQLPIMVQNGGQIVVSLVQGAMEALPQVVTTATSLLQSFLSTISAMLPTVLQQGQQILTSVINGIISVLPDLLLSAQNAVIQFSSTILQNLPQVLQSGVQMLVTLVQGIASRLPDLVASSMHNVSEFARTILDNLPQIFEAGISLLGELIAGILDCLPDLVNAALSMMGSFIKEIVNIDWLSVGIDIINGIIRGIESMAGALIDSARRVASSALDAIKSFFGINSPSKLMAQEVGRWLPPGIAVGVEGNLAPLKNAMREMADVSESSLQSSLSRSLARGAYTAPAPASSFVLNQTINTHDSLSPYEMTLEAENFLKRARWALP